jgi:hypothetical protein
MLPVVKDEGARQASIKQYLTPRRVTRKKGRPGCRLYFVIDIATEYSVKKTVPAVDLRPMPSARWAGQAGETAALCEKGAVNV